MAIGRTTNFITADLYWTLAENGFRCSIKIVEEMSMRETEDSPSPSKHPNLNDSKPGQDDQGDQITLSEILEAKNSLSGDVWRGLGGAILVGIISALLFMGTTWLSGVLIKPVKSDQVYWTVGLFSFVAFGLMALFQVAHDLFQQRAYLRLLESRVRSGERLFRSDHSLVLKYSSTPSKYRVGLFPYKAIAWIGVVFFCFVQ